MQKRNRIILEAQAKISKIDYLGKKALLLCYEKVDRLDEVHAQRRNFTPSKLSSQGSYQFNTNV